MGKTKCLLFFPDFIFCRLLKMAIAGEEDGEVEVTFSEAESEEKTLILPN